MINGPKCKQPDEAGEKVVIIKTGAPVVEFAGVRSQWMDVTPAMATDWLKNNFCNRPIQKETVRAYARDMKGGQWVPTHQGLAFNDQDELIDGQHRLHAIMMAGVTIRMMVTFGLPSRIDGKEMTTMDAVDRGATRSVADQLTIQHGFKNGGVTARICASLGSVCFEERTRRLSVGQTLEVFRAFESAVLYVIEHGSKKPGLRAIGVAAGFAFALMTEDRFWEKETRITAMFKSLMTGDAIEDGTSIKQLRGFLTGEESALFTRTMDRAMADLVLQAIYSDLQGRRDVKLEAAAGGANHFRKLQPERVAKVAALFALPKENEASKPVSGEAVQTPAVAPRPRPTLERLLHEVENAMGIAGFIIIGKGSDAEIEGARAVIVRLARGIGYTAEEIAPSLRRSVGRIKETEEVALTTKQNTILTKLKNKLAS